MLTIPGTASRYCDSIQRRSFLKIGSLAMGGLGLPQLLQAEKAAGGSQGKSVIMIVLPGGPPHLDMYDLKPDAPAEIRGEFKPIASTVPGIEICELLPGIASVMDKVAIIRSQRAPVPDRLGDASPAGRLSLPSRLSHRRLAIDGRGHLPVAGAS